MKEYLGDSVYINVEGSTITLTTEDGLSTDIIVSEPEVLSALLSYLKHQGWKFSMLKDDID